MMTITIQAKRRDDDSDSWGTRNAMRDLNSALNAGQITIEKAVKEANLLMYSWHSTYSQPDMVLRVHMDYSR